MRAAWRGSWPYELNQRLALKFFTPRVPMAREARARKQGGATMHPFHIVDARPWPLTGSGGALILVGGVSGWIHKFDRGGLALVGLCVILVTMVLWWRDVRRESTYQGKHTAKVENGIRAGMILFITREVCFFFAFFWAFYHSSLRPSIEVGSIWPPKHIAPIQPLDVPLLNTTILLSSGATITWAHRAILRSKWLEVSTRIVVTLVLGIIFTTLQALEYANCPFTIADSIYGRTFFVATGFHGLHVVFGTVFIWCIWARHLAGHFSSTHHFGFEGRAWYWHFVDVVWLILFVRVYWWGY